MKYFLKVFGVVLMIFGVAGTGIALGGLLAAFQMNADAILRVVLILGFSLMILEYGRLYTLRRNADMTARRFFGTLAMISIVVFLFWFAIGSEIGNYVRMVILASAILFGFFMTRRIIDPSAEERHGMAMD